VPAIEESAGTVRVQLRLQPKASRDAISVEPDGRLRVALTAPPVDGEANAALVAFIARRVGVAKSAVRLIQGLKSREKTLSIAGASLAQVQTALLGEAR
jgi:uncharacterized protein (TIGR00251 family)